MITPFLIAHCTGKFKQYVTVIRITLSSPKPKTCIKSYQKGSYSLYYQEVIEKRSLVEMHQFECGKSWRVSPESVLVAEMAGSIQMDACDRAGFSPGIPCSLSVISVQESRPAIRWFRMGIKALPGLFSKETFVHIFLQKGRIGPSLGVVFLVCPIFSDRPEGFQADTVHNAKRAALRMHDAHPGPVNIFYGSNIIGGKAKLKFLAQLCLEPALT